jgi:hypothetical protein
MVGKTKENTLVVNKRRRMECHEDQSITDQQTEAYFTTTI